MDSTLFDEDYKNEILHGFDELIKEKEEQVKNLENEISIARKTLGRKYAEKRLAENTKMMRTVNEDFSDALCDVKDNKKKIKL